MSFQGATLVADSTGNVYETNTRNFNTKLVFDYTTAFTDIAVSPTGIVYANTFYDVFRLNLSNNTATHVLDLNMSANGLAFDDDGLMYVGGFSSKIQVYRGSDLGYVRDIALPSGTSSAGDIHIVDDTLYYSASGSRLLTLDLSSGAVTHNVNHGLSALYGMHFADNKLYAYSGKGVYEINPNTGANTYVGTIDIAGSTYGAGTLPGDGVEGTNGADVLFAIFSGAPLFGYGGRDKLFGSSDANKMNGGSGNDILRGYGGKDLLNCGSGDDKALGGGGNDRLIGKGGSDKLNGGGANDRLEGGAGRDNLTGGKGADDFIFRGKFGKDVITDFAANNNNEDINLKGVKAITGFNDLKKHHMSQHDDDVLIKVGSNVIQVEDVHMSDLNAQDFIF